MKETFSGIEKQKLNNAHVSQMNADYIGFQGDSFDSVLCGFIGWDYCYDFMLNKFIGPDTRMAEIYRVIKTGGRVSISAWERQADLEWLEEQLRREYPSLASDHDHGTRSHALVYSRENPDGYEHILKNAGFKSLEIFREKVELCSTDEAEWWQQMRHVGWESYFNRLEKMGMDKLKEFKDRIFKELQTFKQADGIHFTKSVLFACAEK